MADYPNLTELEVGLITGRDAGRKLDPVTKPDGLEASGCPVRPRIDPR